MLSQEDRIRLIHDSRTVLLNRMFDEFCLKSPGSSAEQVCDKIITTARVVQNALSNADDMRLRMSWMIAHRPRIRAGCAA